MRTRCFSGDIFSLWSRQSSDLLPDAFYKRTKDRWSVFLICLDADQQLTTYELGHENEGSKPVQVPVTQV